MTYKKHLEKMTYFVVMIMFFIFPTSIGREQFSVKVTIVLWLFQSGIICFFILQEKVNIQQFLLILLGLGYLIVATFIASTDPNLYVSLARIAPVICFFVLCATTYSSIIEISFFAKLVDIMCVTMIVWNLLTLMRVQPFIEFVNFFYTQLDDYTSTYWSLVRNKPIFTFGVHNFASIFYMHIFLFCYYLYQKVARKRYLIYLFNIMLFTLLLRSSASAGILAVMGLFVVKLFLTDKRKLIFLFLCAGIVLVLLNGTSVYTDYIASFSSEVNGFGIRYSSASDLYRGNYAILKKFPLGIGFHIGKPILNIYFGDSGFIVYLTMGNIFLIVLFFVLIYRYYRININREKALLFTFLVALTELSFAGAMYEKTLYIYIFEIGFYRSLLMSDMEAPIRVGRKGGIATKYYEQVGERKRTYG